MIVLSVDCMSKALSFGDDRSTTKQGSSGEVHFIWIFVQVV